MFSRSLNLWLRIPVAFLVLAAAPGAARAGWVTITNETSRVVVVQGTVTSNGQKQRSRPVRLLPGESVREHFASDSLRVEVFDGHAPDHLLLASDQPIKGAKQAFAVRESPAAVVLVAVKPR
jgi:hypothetical protein